MASQPLELTRGAKWDRCLEKLSLYSFSGVIVGLTSFFFFKKRITRTISFWTTVGIASGYAVGECRFDFKNPLLLHGKKIETLQVSEENAAALLRGEDPGDDN